MPQFIKILMLFLLFSFGECDGWRTPSIVFDGVKEPIVGDSIVPDPPKIIKCYSSDPPKNEHHIIPKQKPKKAVTEGCEEIKVRRVAAQMPRFPGCEDIPGSVAEKKRCADKELLKFIYKNMKLPALYNQSDIGGRVIVRFIVEKNGKLTNIEILREPSQAYGDEVKRIFESMGKWIPGRENGQTVRVQLIFPIGIKLE